MPYIVVESDFSCPHLSYILADEDTFTFLDATVIKATTSKTLSGHHKYAVQDSAFSLLNILEDAGWRVISLAKVDSPSPDTSGCPIRDYAWTLAKNHERRFEQRGEAHLGPEPLSPMFGMNSKSFMN